MSIADAIAKAGEIVEDHKRKLETAHLAQARATIELSTAAARYGQALSGLRALKGVARLEDDYRETAEPLPPDFLRGNAL